MISYAPHYIYHTSIHNKNCIYLNSPKVNVALLRVFHAPGSITFITIIFAESLILSHVILRCCRYNMGVS